MTDQRNFISSWARLNLRTGLPLSLHSVPYLMTRVRRSVSKLFGENVTGRSFGCCDGSTEAHDSLRQRKSQPFAIMDRSKSTACVTPKPMHELLRCEDSSRTLSFLDLVVRDACYPPVVERARMLLFSTVRFDGDKGRHLEPSGKKCGGRAFHIKFVGVGGVYTRTVVCTWCQRTLRAYDDELAPEPSPEFAPFV